MKFYLSIIIIFVLSCTSQVQEQNSIKLVNNVTLKRFHGEYVKDPDPSELNYYESHFNNSNNYQLPLFKLFIHDNYKLYIGIPLNNSDSKIFDIRSKLLIAFKEDIFIDSNEKKIKYSMNDKYILEQYYNIDNHSYFISFFEIKKDSILNFDLNQFLLKERFSYTP